MITKDMIELMKPGSVVVDLAAENGGNIETTKPGQVYTHSSGVIHIGLTDLPSRLATQSSTLYSNNLSKFFLSITSPENDRYQINLQDEVVRGSIVLQEGRLLWPPPPIEIVAPPKVEPKKDMMKAPPKELLPSDYFKQTLQTALVYSAGLGTTF